MESDTEGFYYPVICYEKCVNCGLCETVCPEINPPKVSDAFYGGYIAQSTEKEVLDTSTSGGFVDTLNMHIIRTRNGYCAGVDYDERFLPIHKLVNEYDLAKRFRNSKYAQSNLGNTFQKVQAKLNEGQTVLFTGTPCQVAGLKSFLQKDYPNLYTVDLVCRSVPSPLFWERYLQWQTLRYKSEISSVTCRKKTYGYRSGALEIEFKNGKKYSGSNRIDYYMKCFHHDVCSRPSCYACSFKTAHRCSDFTVFDCWKPHIVAEKLNYDNDKGYSNILVHTEKGRCLIDELTDMVILSADPVKMFEYTGEMERRSITKTPQRDTFYQDLRKSTFLEATKKYVIVSWLDYLIEFLKPARYRIQKLLRRIK
jgi:coenzyme F420-reducing hydrogenase beta subunit